MSWSNLGTMNSTAQPIPRFGGLTRRAMLLFFVANLAHAQAPVRCSAAFDIYTRSVESRLAAQHLTHSSFLAVAHSREKAGLQGQPVIERLTPARLPELDGALLEHWRGTAFAPGVTAESFEALLRNLPGYPTYFSPQVLRATEQADGRAEHKIFLRVRQEHVLSVVLDGTYAVQFGQLDELHRYSTSRSLQIREIADAETSKERVLGPQAENGWLWRLNTYWTFEERGEGLYVQIETVTLSRSIPRGLGWLIGPYVDSIPRDSLSFTLRSVCNALAPSTKTTK